MSKMEEDKGCKSGVMLAAALLPAAKSLMANSPPPPPFTHGTWQKTDDELMQSYWPRHWADLKPKHSSHLFTKYCGSMIQHLGTEDG